MSPVCVLWLTASHHNTIGSLHWFSRYASVFSYHFALFLLLCTARNGYQLLTSVLLAPGGQGKVLQAFDFLRTVAEEPKRFQMLVLSLTDEPVNPIYQVITEILVCVCSCSFKYPLTSSAASISWPQPVVYLLPWWCRRRHWGSSTQ